MFLYTCNNKRSLVTVNLSRAKLNFVLRNERFDPTQTEVGS